MTPGIEFSPTWVPSHESFLHAHRLSCGMFQLDHDKSKFEATEVTFKQHANAWLIVAVEPVLNESMNKIKADELMHGWRYKWFVRFHPSGWNHQEYHGAAKTPEMAKQMAFNIACGAYAAVADVNAESPGELEALRGELRGLRDNLRMLRYSLKTDFPHALDRVKHYLTRAPR